MTEGVTARLAEHGLSLPDPSAPLAAYRPVVVSGRHALFSGHGPINAQHEPVYQGRIGAELSFEDGIGAAQLTGLNVLATAQRAFGGFQAVERVLRVTGFILATPDFTRHPAVLDGCSRLFHMALGEERGSHARTAIGVSSSTLALPITVEVTFELAEELEPRI